MPRGDRTGPWGEGPMTGRGAGRCAGFPVPGYRNPVGFRCGRGFGRGFGFGFGRGRGFGRGFYGAGFPGRVPFWGYYGSYEPAVSEKEFLKKEAEFLEKELEQIKKLLASSKEDEEI